MNSEDSRQPAVVVIGAGMTGLLMAIRLRESGITDVTILEKANNLGGTWRENTYLGVACDVPAHMYTYSFEPNPGWSHRFAHGAEIQRYFEMVGRKYGITDRISFNEAATASTFEDGKWIVNTSKDRTLVADFVINCTGILHHPAKPDIPGLGSFNGSVFHTAEWDHSVELQGKRIGVIGTGSTAAQVIPEVAARAEKLVVFQRTPQWILPIGNRPVLDAEKESLRRDPIKVLKLRRWYMRGFSELLTKAVTGHKLQNFVFSNLCKWNLRRSVRDPKLRAKLRPAYKVGCKRIVVNTTFYPAIQRENTYLETEAIEAVTESGITTTEGTHHDLDVIILATGFKPTAYMRPMDLRGVDGITIDEAWKDKIRTYRSVCMPGFPNSFLMLGPNSPVGNFSVIEMSEVQCGYVLAIIDRWRRREFDAIDVTDDAVARFSSYMREGMKKTVWVGGCQSWYLDADGDPILWPYTWDQWVKEMREPDMDDFKIMSFGDSGDEAAKKAA